MQSLIILSQIDAETADLVRVQIRNLVLSLFLSSCFLSGVTAQQVDVFVKMMMSEAQDGRQYMREAETAVIFAGVWLLVRVLLLLVTLRPYETCLQSSVWPLVDKEEK